MAPDSGATGRSDRPGLNGCAVGRIIALKLERYADRVALSGLEAGRWRELTYRELSARAVAVTNWLIHAGVRPGDRIAILSESRPEWAIALFGALRSGAVVVPLDAKLTVAEVGALLADAAPRVLFISSSFADAARKFLGALPSLTRAVVLDEGAAADDLPRLAALRSPAAAWPERTPAETALIIYTSGTTGQPKGVMISFGNLIFEVSRLEGILRFRPGDVLLSILPLNHLLELTCGLLGALHAGGHVCYCPTLYPDEIVRLMRERRVTMMVTVPLFLKMLHRGLERELGKARRWRRALFQAAWVLSGAIPAPALRRLLFAPVHRALGGRLRAFFSGGAPLEPPVGAFFDRLGLPVYQGYGLTETSPVVALNRPRANRLGSVGRPLEGVEVRVLARPGEDGEIVTRGAHVMQGYYRRPDLTREVIDAEGWLHTGDVGRLDRNGFLWITGRLKHLIVLPGGKKVHPEEVEAVLARSPAIKELCVLPRVATDGITAGGEEVCAVVVPADALAERLREMPAALEEELRREVERLATTLAPYKRPRSVHVWRGELPKTPTRKVKREVVQESLGGGRR